ILIAAVLWSIYGSRPGVNFENDIPDDQFSTARAFSHVEALGQEPHYVGSPAHSKARNYIVSELEKLGLIVQTQEAYSLNKRGVITRPQNIITRIEGSGDGKALLLLTHYDSAMHSSYGASDAASAVGTILEGVRAWLASGAEPVNDIIIVFSDAEELGLNGADIFVEEHPWAKDVGLALNFEARGSGGKPFMLLETNEGNKALLEQFVAAGVEYPVSNSLAYSVYKMLPNDTDLTVLREQGNINGLNFAFIDDHFDYHTANDVPQNLDLNTLAHQGAYLMPLLNYFSRAPLENLDSEEELVFFDVPGIKMVVYPYSWIFTMLILAIALFVILLFYAAYRGDISFVKALKSFVPMLISLLLSGFLGYGFWKLMLYLYPQYPEMEQGFTYNGYYYIAAVVFLSLAVCFYTYNRFRKPGNAPYLYVAPLLIWILLSTLAAFYLKGAAYFIIPVFFGLLQFFFLLKMPKNGLLIQSLLSLPAILILLPFITTFPVALGLKMLFLSAVLTVLLWLLAWPVFSYYSKLQLLGFLSFVTFIVLILLAHFKSDFSAERPKPNSLVYL
ncbi:MAG: M28 family peptidase, partial [Salinimicrobium sp.]